MRRLILFIAAVGAAVVAASAGAVTAPPQSFTDETGDAGSAPDITTVSITNDDHGQYTFTINFATPYVNNAILAILIDSDRNSLTGDPKLLGSEYLFEDDYGSHTSDLGVWSNNDWQDTPQSTTSVTVAPDNKSMTMSVNKSEIGNTTSFNFFVLSSDGTFDAGHVDDAPSGAGAYAYTEQTVFSLSTGSFRDGPAKAGGGWTVSLNAVRSDNGQKVGAGATIACSAKEGSHALALRSSSFGSGGATCTFAVPKKPKHATVRATVTISENGQSVSKTFIATTH